MDNGNITDHVQNGDVTPTPVIAHNSLIDSLAKEHADVDAAKELADKIEKKSGEKEDDANVSNADIDALIAAVDRAEMEAQAAYDNAPADEKDKFLTTLNKAHHCATEAQQLRSLPRSQIRGRIQHLSIEIARINTEVKIEEHDAQEQLDERQVAITAHTVQQNQPHYVATPHKRKAMVIPLTDEEALKEAEKEAAKPQQQADLYKAQMVPMHDATIAQDMHKDFSDHLMGHTKDGHAVMHGNKLQAIKEGGIDKYALWINKNAQAAAKHHVLGMDAKAAATATALTQQATDTHAPVAKREAAVGEMMDAAERHTGGRTFVGQEIDDAMPELQKHYGNKLGNLLDLSTGDVMSKLIKNGWAKDHNLLLDGYDKNRQWSADIVKNLDRNGDGQLSTAEIEFAIDHTKRSYELQQKIDAAKKQVSDIEDKARDFVASKTKLGKEVQGIFGSLQGVKAFDTDKDSKVELAEVVKALQDKGIKEIKDMNGDGKLDAKDIDALMHGQKTIAVQHVKNAPTQAQATPHAAAKKDLPGVTH